MQEQEYLTEKMYSAKTRLCTRGGWPIRAAVSAAQRMFQGLCVFQHFKHWHFDNLSYLAVFKAIAVNVLILVVAILR